MSEISIPDSSNLMTPEEARLAERQAETKKCLVELRSSNPHSRSRAARRLGELRAEPEVLLGALSDRNAFVRSAAAEALGHTEAQGRPEIVEALLSAIDDPNAYVCAAAVNSLGLLKAVGALEQVLDCLEDRNPVVLQSAILALARINPPGIAEKLAAYLDSDHYLVHMAALRAVSILDYQPAGVKVHEALENFMRQTPRHDLKLAKLYIEVVSRLEVRSAINLLVEIAMHEIGLRSSAVDALIQMNAENAAPVLVPLLADPSNRLRRHLIEMMVQANYRVALPVIRPLLKDQNVTVREASLAAVARWEDRVSIDAVRWMAYHDPNPFVRPQALSTLVALARDEAAPDLVALSQDLNLQVRRSAAYFMGRLDCMTDEMVTALNRLGADPDVADAACEALEAHALKPCPPEDVVAKTIIEVPAVMRADAGLLLEMLCQWQSEINEHALDYSLEDVARLDEALSTLIVVLKKSST